MKFLSTSEDILIVHIDQKTERECYVVSLWVRGPMRIENQQPSTSMIAMIDLNSRTKHEIRMQPG